MLKSLPKCFKSHWKNHVNELTFAYNNTKSKSTYYIQHFLLFGREGRLSIDNIFDNNSSTSKKVIYSQFAQHWQKACKKFSLKLKIGMNHFKRKVKTIMLKKNI